MGSRRALIMMQSNFDATRTQDSLVAIIAKTGW